MRRRSCAIVENSGGNSFRWGGENSCANMSARWKNLTPPNGSSPMTFIIMRREIAGESFPVVRHGLGHLCVPLRDFFPEVAKSRRVVWLPHSASPDFALVANSTPRNELFLSGAVSKSYPLRERLNALMESGCKEIVRDETIPVTTAITITPMTAGSDALLRGGFGSTRAAFTDAWSSGDAVAKHFEIPATGALLVADIAIERTLKGIGVPARSPLFSG